MTKRAEPLFKFWGWNTQGDFGPWTFYTDQRKNLVYFLKAPPLEPPSLWQRSIRNTIRLVAYNWRALPPRRRRDWELAAKRAHLQITGYNLFVYWSCTHNDKTIQTVERLSHIRLIPLNYDLP
jgi:hypothetical protein